MSKDKIETKVSGTDKKSDESCCENESSCCGVSKGRLAQFLRHVADFFDKKKE